MADLRKKFNIGVDDMGSTVTWISILVYGINIKLVESRPEKERRGKDQMLCDFLSVDRSADAGSSARPGIIIGI